MINNNAPYPLDGDPYDGPANNQQVALAPQPGPQHQPAGNGTNLDAEAMRIAYAGSAAICLLSPKIPMQVKIVMVPLCFVAGMCVEFDIEHNNFRISRALINTISNAFNSVKQSLGL